MTRLIALVLLALSAAWRPAMAEAVPVFSDTGPDATAYGAAEGYPIGSRETIGSQRTLVGAYSHYDTLRPSAPIPAAPTPSVLHRAKTELELSYSFQGESQTLASYLDRNPATGLLILSDHTILYEHYRYARTDTDRFTSQSMAKTVVAMALGVAVGEGAVRSIDDTVADYVTELANAEVGRTPIRALLSMTSGISFHEVYDGKDDIMRLSRALTKPDSAGPLAAVMQFESRAAPPGTHFNYAGLDTELLGMVVSRATKMPLSAYVSTRIWQKIGAEAAASWALDAKGNEIAYCCFNATLRDWGRFGLLLAHDGMWDGRQIIPRQWMLDATTAPAAFLAPGVGGRRLGYGYQVWLMPGTRRQFSLRGIYGQVMLIDPATRTVLVHTAVRPKATNNVGEAELAALWNALVASRGS